VQFISGDISTFPIKVYDVIILADVLHYLNTDLQEQLITRCMGAVTGGGKIIIREGNADLKKRHWGTQMTEFFSVKLLKFNRSVNRLNFISGARILSLANKPGFTTHVLDDTKYTSNVIFVINKLADKA
jgi:2-polyprenyl-3-methyl-5-hydroxy-6-metoxy-1,4-benzoquinol methylase